MAWTYRKYSRGIVIPSRLDSGVRALAGLALQQSKSCKKKEHRRISDDRAAIKRERYLLYSEEQQRRHHTVRTYSLLFDPPK